MPPDIRGFFGPKGGQSVSNSQEKKHPIRTSTKPPTPATESRKRKSVALDEDDDEDEVFPATKTRGSRKSRKIVDDDDDEDEDGFAPAPSPKKASTKKSRAKPETDEDEDEVIPPPKKRSTTKHVKADSDDGENKATPVKKKSAGRKPKKEDDEDITTPVKKKSAPRKPKKEDEENIRPEVQDIFDKIPTVRPPTPPARDPNKKFDYRTHAQNAAPPPAAGSTDKPTGAENCLAGLTFVFTGLLGTLGREEGQELVKQHGGKVTGAPSKKTSFVVLGSDAGPKKLETIQQYGLRTINEEGLFELIRKLPANGGDGKAANQYKEKQEKEAKQVEAAAKEMERQEKKATKEPSIGSAGLKTPRKDNTTGASNIDSRLWTVKYAPTAVSMICGNKTAVEKLQRWLRAWPSNARIGFKKAGADMSGVFRAVMIHGPPGIGKTTAAHLAAQLEGYDIVESNASDTRSKKLVETGLKGVLDTTSLFGYFAGDGKKVEAQKKKLVLIMDEVDGMSAGDRGGVGALAAVCKKTHIPMILICNERKLPKMRPFDHVTYDLPFRKPTTDMVRSRIMTICYREGLQIPVNVINALIEGSRADIRQIINMLSTAKLDQTAMDFEGGKKMSKAWEKHVILKPWDIVSKILGGGMFAPNSTSTLNDKIELYFNDHEFSSLMLQENYLGTNPLLSNGCSGKEKNLKLLELADKAAESISDGDLVDRMIHGSQQQWSLMPTHAVFSFVRPASFVSGSQAGNQTRFTSWLGQNSKTSKLMRYIKEIQGHMRLRASGDRHEIRQQYLPLLWYKLINEMRDRGKESVEDVIELMDSYFLTKDDWDAILELGVGPMNMDNVKLDSQTKAAFTRLYNQQSHPLPFMKASQVVAPKNMKKVKPDLEEAIEESDENDAAFAGSDVGEEDEEEALDLKKDKFVKVPKAKKAPATKGKKAKAANDDDDGLGESEEDVKPKKGKTAAKGKATAGKGRGKK